jgi:hypothetical protein
MNSGQRPQPGAVELERILVRRLVDGNNSFQCISVCGAPYYSGFSG